MKKPHNYERAMFFTKHLLAVLLFIIIQLGCKKENAITDSPLPDDPPWDQVIAWRKPGATDQQVSDWINSVQNAGGVYEPVNVRACPNCDNSLILLSGARIQTYINGRTVRGTQRPTASSPNSGPTPPPIILGEQGPVYLSWNFKIKSNPFPQIALPIANHFNSPTNYREPPVKIAIFDTGIEPIELSKFLYRSSSSSCISGAEGGWNFVSQNPNFIDDNILKHGTTLTRFITNQVVQSGANPVEILPVKTHNADGIGYLFDVLCAFAYAKERGVNIINASFGFYSPKSGAPIDPPLNLLRRFVGHYLTDNNILLVASAGNADDLTKLTDFKYLVNYDARNLSQINFFPASLAKDPAFPNVISVTTAYVSNGIGTISPSQNFSSEVVDIGVIADTITADHYVFKNPLLPGNETVEGSSYAASIVTGKLSANYYLYKNLINSNPQVPKTEIIRILQASQIVQSNPTLLSKIRNGIIMKK